MKLDFSVSFLPVHAVCCRSRKCATCSGFSVRHAPDSVCGLFRIHCAACAGLCTRILTVDYAEELLNELKTQFSNSAVIIDEIKHKHYELRETKRAINNLLDLAENFGSGSAKDRLKERETQKALLEREIKNLETRKDESEIEISPEVLTIVITTWRNDLLEAKQNHNVAMLRALLARFVSRIEIDYHRVRIWYTYPIDKNNPLVNAPLRGVVAIEQPIKILTLEWENRK